MSGYVITLKKIDSIYQDVDEREKIQKNKEGQVKRISDNIKSNSIDPKKEERNRKIIELWDSQEKLTYKQIAEILLKQRYWLDEDDIIKVIAVEKRKRQIEKNNNFSKMIIENDGEER